MAKEKQFQPIFKAGDILAVKDATGVYILEVLKDVKREIGQSVAYQILIGPSVEQHYMDSYLSIDIFESLVIHRYAFDNDKI